MFVIADPGHARLCLTAQPLLAGGWPAHGALTIPFLGPQVFSLPPPGGVQACVGAAGAGDGVGGPHLDLSVVAEPHVVTRGVGCSPAAQGHLFPLTGPLTGGTWAQPNAMRSTCK